MFYVSDVYLQYDPVAHGRKGVGGVSSKRKILCVSDQIILKKLIIPTPCKGYLISRALHRTGITSTSCEMIIQTIFILSIYI